MSQLIKAQKGMMFNTWKYEPR